MYSNHVLRLLKLHVYWGLPCLVLASVAMQAQSSTITADPNAEALRVIWQVQGDPIGGNDEVGYRAGGLGDLFGTGKGAWAVFFGEFRQWHFYRNDSDDIAADTIPFKTINTYGAMPPVVGEYWGAGTKGLVMFTGTADTTGGNTKYYQELHAFHVEADSISDSIATMMNTRTMTPQLQLGISEVFAVDLNNDGADELILPLAGVTSDTGTSFIPEIWIFKGGPDFRLDSPTVIARDTRKNDFLWWETATGDFDGDGHTDIFMGGGHSGDTRKAPRMTFYWGNGTLEGYTDTNNRRTVVFEGERPNSAFGMTPFDSDGDGVLDLAIDQLPPPDRGTYIFRSRTGKNARTRSYDRSDADLLFPNLMGHYRGGYTNDSSRRYAMLGLGPVEGQAGYPNAMYFSGGDNGPDLAYDATSFFGGGTPVSDVDGDGWDDIIAGRTNVNIRAGIAVIYAGGPYIPSPKVSGVEAIAGEGHPQAITVWPNPMRDDLHIAWRGDLRRTPRSFRVHDLLGRDVAHGDVPASTKAALWRSGDLPNGIYLLSVYAHDGTIITTTRIIKQ